MARGYFTGEECDTQPPIGGQSCCYQAAVPRGVSFPPSSGTFPRQPFPRWAVSLRGPTGHQGQEPPGDAAGASCSRAAGLRLENPNYCVQGQIWAVLWVYLNLSYLG